MIMCIVTSSVGGHVVGLRPDHVHDKSDNDVVQDKSDNHDDQDESDYVHRPQLRGRPRSCHRP